MRTQELTPDQKKQIKLAKRRAYYSANRNMIRPRDNRSAVLRYQADPDRQREAQARHKKRLQELPKTQKSITDSPDFLQFVYAIMAEENMLAPV